MAARVPQGINNLTDVWDTSKGECVVMMQSELEKMFDKVRARLLAPACHNAACLCECPGCCALPWDAKHKLSFY